MEQSLLKSLSGYVFLVRQKEAQEYIKITAWAVNRQASPGGFHRPG
jgi:hypothetical protein